MNTDRTVLTDEMYERVAPLCPGKAVDPGRTAVDNRLFLEAVFWRFRTGSSWRDLPPRFGPWNSVFKRFRRWTQSGVFVDIVRVLSDEFDLVVDDTIMPPQASGAKQGDLAPTGSDAQRGSDPQNCRAPAAIGDSDSVGCSARPDS